MSDIPLNVQEHLKKLIQSSGLKDRPQAFEDVSENWLQKLEMLKLKP